MNNKKLIYIVLGILGAWIVIQLLGGFGHIVGFIFSLVLPLILIGLGFVGMKNGKTLIGGAMLAIGAILLLGKLLHFFFPLLMVALVALVLYLLLRKNNRRSF